MSDLAIPLAHRPDIEVTTRLRRGQRVHLLRDPLSLKHFEYSEPEFCLWRLLDGRRTFAAIRDEFERRQAPLRLTRSQFEQFLAGQHAWGLVVSNGPGQAAVLSQRRAEAVSKSRWGMWLNPLAIRFGGIDPQPVLDATRLLWGWFCSLPMLCATALLVVLTALFAAARATEISARLPDLAALARPEQLWLLVLTVGGVKVLHELAHACVCRKLGAECHELGLLLLMGVPCLYCDVSDAWRLTRRRDRIAVSLAGIWVELILASVAFWVWWRATPGLVSLVALNTMVVCSVGTLVFNLNPLLKYDGYYALSDLLEVPNLSEKSQAALWGQLSTPFSSDALGTRKSPFTRGTVGLAAFGLASLVYRTLLTGVILFTVYKLSREWRAEVLGWAVIALVGFGLVARGVPGARRWSQQIAAGFAPWQTIVWQLLLLLVATGLLLVPWPYSVVSVAALEPAQAERVYVTAPGRVIWAVDEGAMVAAGDELVRLENRELEWEIAQLRGELAVAEKTLETLQRRQGDDPAAARDLPATRARVVDLGTQLAQREADARRLNVRSATAGRVWAGEYRPVEPLPEGSELPDWSESPLAPQRRGAWLETGTVVGWVATGSAWDAVATLPQADVELIADGATVRILIETGGGEIVTGRVDSIARMTRLEPPASTSGVATIAEMSAGPAPRAATQLNSVAGAPAPYEVRVRLDHPPRTPLALRSQARIRIDAGEASWAWWAWRELQRVLGSL